MSMPSISMRAMLAAAAVAALSLAARVASAQDCLWPMWTQVASNPELARYEHAMAFDAARGNVVMFGGRTASNNVLGDTVIWNGKAWQPNSATGPAARRGHAMVYDPVSQRVLLTGGLNTAGTPFRDTWAWDGSAWALLSENAPVSVGPVLVYADGIARPVLVNHLGELWIWSGSQWELASTTGPDANAAAYDPVRQRVVVTEMSGTFAWDFGEWFQVSQSAHPYTALNHHTMFYSAAKGGVMIFAGNDGQGLGVNYRGGSFVVGDGIWSTWGYHGFFGLPEYRRQDHATVVLANGTAMTFGGRQGSAFGDTRILTFATTAGETYPFINHPAGRTVDPGETHTMFVRMLDPSDFFGFIGTLANGYQWRRNGVPLQDGQGAGAYIEGSNLADLTLSGIRLSDAGVYDCVVTACGPQMFSDPAVITVRCPANLTTTALPSQPGYGVPDDKLNSDDFFYYLIAYGAGNLAVADITSSGATQPGHPGWLVPDGVLNSDDFFAFLTLYASGC